MILLDTRQPLPPVSRRIAFACLVTGPLLIASPGALAGLSGTGLLTADDGETGDWFGFSVDVDGNLAVVSAYRDDDEALNAGATYLYDGATGQELHKIVPGDLSPGDGFGVSVSVNGGIGVFNTKVAVGAHLSNEAADSGGAVYIYDAGNPFSPIQRHKLTASDPQERAEFGFSVSISGNLALIGAPFHDGATTSDSGAAYLFDTSTGQQLAKFTASDADSGDQFGFSVALDGNTAVVGANWVDNKGAAYIFDVGTLSQVDKIVASDAAGNDLFGHAVAIDDGRLVVGAWGDDDGGGLAGAAYLFDVSTPSNTTEIAKLTAPDAQTDAWFGQAVDIDGDQAVVGAWFHDSAGQDAGAIYYYDTAGGASTGIYFPQTLEQSDWFGGSVALDGATTVAGAFGVDELGNDAGGAYLIQNGTNLSVPGDANRDGFVDLVDLDILGQNWEESGDWGDAEFSGDGIVNLVDLDILGQWWGYPFGPAFAQEPFNQALAASGILIPEPTSAALLLPGLLVWRRRSR